MATIRYLLKRIFNLSRSGLGQRLREVHNISGKSRLLLLLDIIYCTLRYQSGYNDYAALGMWELNAKQRGELLTSGKNNRYVAALNNKRDWHFFDNKIEFLKTFGDSIGREYLDLRSAALDEFESFIGRNPVFIAKPVDDMCGNGVDKIDVSGMDISDLYHTLKTKEQLLAEEVIRQHPAISAINATSVNTIRIVTIRTGDIVHLVMTCLRCGRSGKVMDNFRSGGMAAPIDAATGVINSFAVDRDGMQFTCHPDSGVEFEGFLIPMWTEVKQLVMSAARRVPGIRYVGWDVALTEDGPVLVEGNQFPDHSFYQLRAQQPHTFGLLPVFDRAVPYKSLKPIK